MPWEKFCLKKLFLSLTEVNRVIDFYALYTNYPRIIVAGLSFETIMYIQKDLNNYLINDLELLSNLKSPLKEMKVVANMQIKIVPHEEIEMQNTQYDWNAAWEISDAVLNSSDAVKNPVSTCSSSDVDMEDVILGLSKIHAE
jgi:hypothetical protein